MWWSHDSCSCSALTTVLLNKCSSWFCIPFKITKSVERKWRKLVRSISSELLFFWKTQNVCLHHTELYGLNLATNRLLFPKKAKLMQIIGVIGYSNSAHDIFVLIHYSKKDKLENGQSFSVLVHVETGVWLMSFLIFCNFAASDNNTHFEFFFTNENNVILS